VLIVLHNAIQMAIMVYLYCNLHYKLVINKLFIQKQVQILSMMVEGSSKRSISRVVDVSINTATKLLVDAGTACAAFHDVNIRDINAKRI
jgi:transposase-like protein